jgi:hypothetical protein
MCELTLNELLEAARHHVMTDEEKEAQRQSWVRGEMALTACPLCKKSDRFMRQPGTCSHPFHDEPFRKKVEEVSPPSPEIAQSRARFEKWAVANLPKVVGPVDWPMWWECWQAAERDTRERCTQIV